MAKIVVNRVYATAASLASVTLSLDGKNVGRIKSGTTLTVDAPEGPHELRAHQSWQASNPLRVVLRDNDQEVVVELTTSQDPDNPADLGFLLKPAPPEIRLHAAPERRRLSRPDALTTSRTGTTWAPARLTVMCEWRRSASEPWRLISTGPLSPRRSSVHNSAWTGWNRV